MTKSRGKSPATLGSSDPELEQSPDEARQILWKIARDPKQSGTARVAACRLLLADARERDGGETRDLNRRAAALLRQVAN
jgi:hypothetical protein